MNFFRFSKNPKNLKLKTFGVLISSFFLTMFCYVLFSYDIFSEIENRSWDWRIQSTTTSKKADPKIKIIMIDQSSLEALAQHEKIFWPWPRGIYEAVINFLKKSNARGVAFDILFTEQSSYGVDDDVSFASSFSESLPIVSAVALRSKKDSIDFAHTEFKEIQENFEQTREIKKKYLQKLSKRSELNSIVLPIPEILNKSAALGNVSAESDSDGIYRHVTPGALVNDIPILHLSFALFEATRNDNTYANIYNSLDDENRLAVNFKGPAGTFDTYSIASIIKSYQQIESGEKPVISLDTFNDSLVFIGMSAPGLLDLRPTPLSPVYPGVEFHATVLDNLIQDDFAVKAKFYVNIIISFLLTLLISFSIIFASDSKTQILTVVFILLSFTLACFYFASHGIWIAMAIPLFGSILSIIYSFFFQYKLEGEQHRFIKGVFKSYVSPEVIDEIVKDPSKLALGGEKREITVFFSDLAGFTAMSESLEAEKLVALLNRYLSEMTKIILKSGGTLDKYEGDAIIAFWNAPMLVENHPQKAVQAAIDCQKSLRLLQPELEKEFGVQLKMRIGIHTGVANVGNFGSFDRFNYTIIGDAPNLASRLEGANKLFGSEILFSRDTQVSLSNDITTRKIAEIKVVGRNQSVIVYTISDDEELNVVFKDAVSLYEKGSLEEALKMFSTLDGDPISQSYCHKINELLKDFEGNKLVFDPVWKLDQK